MSEAKRVLVQKVWAVGHQKGNKVGRPVAYYEHEYKNLLKYKSQYLFEKVDGDSGKTGSLAVTVKLAEEHILTLDIVDSINEYAMNDDRKGVITAVNERIEELTQ